MQQVMEVIALVLRRARRQRTRFLALAFGFGVERLLMIKYQIPDLRMFYEGDLRFLRQF
jgi:phenylalanyl-tRNA synthetase alpha chain